MITFDRDWRFRNLCLKGDTPAYVDHLKKVDPGGEDDS